MNTKQMIIILGILYIVTGIVLYAWLILSGIMVIVFTSYPLLSFVLLLHQATWLTTIYMIIDRVIK